MAVDTIAPAQARGSSAGWRARLTRRLPTVASRLWLYHQLHRERAQLRALSDRERHDIGISRYDALQEARKPFWRF
ncbi:MAG TPA: DUF1127 domain-containing protein [Alphaproteobacteria bacterium]|nr:DUF1127 domain-containing protein [Alphaproteobacteria bacterium]